MTEFVKVILAVYWSKLKNQIFLRIFIPYVLYLGVTLYYMINVVCAEDLEETGWESWIGFANLLCAGVQIYIEIVQLLDTGG